MLNEEENLLCGRQLSRHRRTVILITGYHQGSTLGEEVPIAGGDRFFINESKVEGDHMALAVEVRNES